uniref:K Homology domain-containing protein n=1 Tax=Pinguiococcus pyrenoidosus TaxID=172671 RepID=A0A7R9YDX4_9STRA|mmetsp:Transcript_5662/g.22248  ORF Transcript_5662/g.22248 Transcript_5662/m.22248 type:complete len:1496 (+) Transcript_5662:253-4740(+)
MEASSAVLELMRGRLAEAQNERETVREQLNKLDAEIKGHEKRMPKRPRESREEMEARIEQLEYRRTTTSMSLQDEKSLLREIDNLKKSIKCLAVVDEALELLNSKRDQRSACHDRIRVLSSALQEFTAGIKRMELAERLGVSSVDLQSVDVEVPAEKAGELVGRGGQNMRRLQEECGVSAQLDSKTEQETVQLHLEGTPQGLAMALERVNRISATVTQEVTLTPAQRSMLVMNRAAVLQELSGHFNVRMDLRGGVRRREGGVDEPTVVEITGVPDAIDALKAYLDSPDFAGEERIDFDLEQVARVVGKGGENLKKIQAEYKVDLDIDRSTGHVVLRGSPLEVTRARSGVLEMLRGVQDVEEIIVITNPAHVSALLDNQGEALREARTRFEARIDFEREGDAVSGEHEGKPVVAIMRVRAPVSRCGLAAQYLRDRLSVCDRELIRIQVPCVALPAIFGKGGSNIKRMRQEHEVIIDYEGPGSGSEPKPRTLREVLAAKIETGVRDADLLDTFLIHGGSAEGRSEAVQELQTIAANSQVELYEFCESELARRFLGSEGEATRKALEECGVEEWSAHRDDEGSATGAVILKGSIEALANGSMHLSRFEAANLILEVEVLKEDVAALSSSPTEGKAAIAVLQEATGAKIRLQGGGRRGDDQEAKVILRGTQDGIEFGKYAVLQELGYLPDASALPEEMAQKLRSNEALASRKTAVLPLCSAAVGPLIGQAGSNIRKLLKDFPAIAIDVLNNRSPSVLRLRGPAEGVDAALPFFFAQLVEEPTSFVQTLRFDKLDMLAASDSSNDAFQATKRLAEAFAVVGDLSEKSSRRGRGRGSNAREGKDGEESGSLLLAIRGPPEAVSDARETLESILANKSRTRLALTETQRADIIGEGGGASTMRATLEALAVSQGASVSFDEGVRGLTPAAIEISGAFVEVQRTLRSLYQHLEFLYNGYLKAIPVSAAAMSFVASARIQYMFQREYDVQLRRMNSFGLRNAGTSANPMTDMSGTCVLLISGTTAQPEATLRLQRAEESLRRVMATHEEVSARLTLPGYRVNAIMYGRSGRHYSEMRPRLGPVHCYATSADGANAEVHFTPVSSPDAEVAEHRAKIAAAVAVFEQTASGLTEVQVSLAFPGASTDDFLRTLIGKQGKNIRAFEQKHGVRVDINKGKDPMATVRIDPAYVPPEPEDEESDLPGGTAEAQELTEAQRLENAHHELVQRIATWQETAGRQSSSASISRLIPGLTASELRVAQEHGLDGIKEKFALKSVELRLAERCIRVVGDEDKVNNAELEIFDMLAGAEAQAEEAARRKQEELFKLEEQQRIEEEAREDGARAEKSRREEQARLAILREAEDREAQRKAAAAAEALRNQSLLAEAQKRADREAEERRRQQERFERQREEKLQEEAKLRADEARAAEERALVEKQQMQAVASYSDRDFIALSSASAHQALNGTANGTGDHGHTNGGGLNGHANPVPTGPSAEASSLLDSLLADWPA